MILIQYADYLLEAGRYLSKVSLLAYIVKTWERLPTMAAASDLTLTGAIRFGRIQSTGRKRNDYKERKESKSPSDRASTSCNILCLRPYKLGRGWLVLGDNY